MKIKDTSKPWELEGFTIESHEDNGIVDLSKLTLHLEPEQKDSYITGYVLLERLKGKSLNSAVLKYLVENPKYFPESWKEKTKEGYTQYIYFWGTIFRYSGGGLYVRYGYWDGGRVVSNFDWLDGGWRGRSPAASLASPLVSEPKILHSDSLSLELPKNSDIEVLEQVATKLKYQNRIYKLEE